MKHVVAASVSILNNTPAKCNCARLPEVAAAFRSAAKPRAGSLHRETSKFLRLGWCRITARERQSTAAHEKSPPATDTFTRLEFVQRAELSR